MYSVRFSSVYQSKCPLGILPGVSVLKRGQTDNQVLKICCKRSKTADKAK